jgi:hypothetical protein
MNWFVLEMAAARSFGFGFSKCLRRCGIIWETRGDACFSRRELESSQMFVMALNAAY